MRRFSVIGICAAIVILVAFLAIPAAVASPAEPAVAQGNECPVLIDYEYDGSVVPEDYTAGPWVPVYYDLTGVDWYSDEEILHIDAYNSPNGVGFYHEEPSLAVAEKYMMEVNMYIENSGGGLMDFVWGVMDGQKAAAVGGIVRDYDNIAILIWWVPEPPGEPVLYPYQATVNLSIPATYRLEVERGVSVSLFRNDIELITAPYDVDYDDLPNYGLPDYADVQEFLQGPLEFPDKLIAIGAYSSDIVWDYVNLQACGVTAQPILQFFDQSVEDGALEGVGPSTKAAEQQLEIVRRHLERADFFIDRGLTTPACNLLYYLYMSINYGAWVEGEGVPELLDMIQSARSGLPCAQRLPIP